MVKIKVYGAEQLCASCVNAPSSKETASWLQAALERVYLSGYGLEYIDIYSTKDEEDRVFAQRIFDEDLWYPVVVIDGDITTEGNPDLKVIYAKLDQQGVPRKE